MIQATKPTIGAPISRLDGPQKVTRTTTYAFEYQFARLPGIDYS
jgi:hypothetical protein